MKFKNRIKNIPYKRFLSLCLIIAISFLAGVFYNSITGHRNNDTKDISIRLEAYLYEDSYSQNRVNGLINTLYFLLFKNGGTICYFDTLSINQMPPGIRYENVKYWKRGVLTVLRDNYLFLLNYPQLKKYKNLEDSYQLIKENNSLSRALTESKYLKSVQHLKQFRTHLIEDKRHLPRRYQDWLKYLKLVKQQLESQIEILNNKILWIKQSKISAANYSNEIDDTLYEVQGNLWAIGHLLSSVSSSFVMILNEKQMMIELQKVLIKSSEIDKENYTNIHRAKDYITKATEAMKQQQVNIKQVLNLIAVLDCDTLCQMQRSKVR